jgi:hypothetical protein
MDSDLHTYTDIFIHRNIYTDRHKNFHSDSDGQHHRYHDCNAFCYRHNY